MWTRSGLKMSAKGVLRGNYWISLAAVLIVGIITSVFSGLYATGLREYMTSYSQMMLGNISIEEFENTVASMSGKLIRAYITALIVSIFIFGPLAVGSVKFFLKSAQGESSLGNIWSGFKTNYLHVVWTLFKRDLFVALWSLLFLIPGIIKSYQYVMVEYILADNPDISSHDALVQSREMMKGNKWRFFVLQLSFLGWLALGALACGLGTVFVTPYMQATYVQFYLSVKPQKVITQAAEA